MTRITTTPPDTLPAPTRAPIRARIHARIHDSALKRVTRIYASTLSDVLIETLQNARAPAPPGSASPSAPLPAGRPALDPSPAKPASP